MCIYHIKHSKIEYLSLFLTSLSLSLSPFYHRFSLSKSIITRAWDFTSCHLRDWYRARGSTRRLQIRELSFGAVTTSFHQSVKFFRNETNLYSTCMLVCMYIYNNNSRNSKEVWYSKQLGLFGTNLGINKVCGKNWLDKSVQIISIH